MEPGVRFVVSERSLKWGPFFHTNDEEAAKEYYKACTTKCSGSSHFSEFELVQDAGEWYVNRRPIEWRPVRSFVDEEEAIKFFTFGYKPGKDTQLRLERCELIVGH